MKKFLCSFLSAAILFAFSGCGSLSTTQKGTLYGAGGGAALGAGIGALIGKGKGAAIGGAIGTIVGGTAGTLIGKHMQKKADEIAAQVDGAQVSTVTDVNGYTAVKVTFDEGILFAFGKSDLSASAKNSLNNFAQALISEPNTDVQIYGHTDNIGSRAANDKVSTARANNVRNYLVNKGVPASRLTAQGLAYDYPVASNDTEEGRAQNRRVEVYISADQNMIDAANNGTLQ